MESIHIIYALKFGGGEGLLKNYYKSGDKIISLSKESVLEGYLLIRQPFRINSKNRYYNLWEYFLSIPSLLIMSRYLFLKQKDKILVFHGFPFQFIAPIFSLTKHFNAIHIVYHQYKKRPKTFLGLFSCYLESMSLKISKSLYIVGVSPWVIERLKENFTLSTKNKIYRMYVPALTQKYQEQSNDYQEHYIIYGARLVKEKGHLRLLKYINQLNLKDPYIKDIIFCGSGPEKERIQNYFSENLKNYNLRIYDTLDHKKYIQLVKNSKAFVFPSYREAFPIALLEAVTATKNVFAFEEYLVNSQLGLINSKEKLGEYLREGKIYQSERREELIRKMLTDYSKNRTYQESIRKYKS